MTTVSEDRSAPSSPAEKPAGTATPSKVAVPVRIVTVQLNAPTGMTWVSPAAFRYVERVPERGTATTADVIFGAVPSGPLMTGSILVYAVMLVTLLELTRSHLVPTATTSMAEPLNAVIVTVRFAPVVPSSRVEPVKVTTWA